MFFFVEGYSFLSIDLRSITEAMNVLPLTFSWTEKRNHEHFSSIKCGRKKKQQKSFHKGWFIPNEVLQRIFFTWPAKTVFVPKNWPSTYQVIMCETVPEVCEGDHSFILPSLSQSSF